MKREEKNALSRQRIEEGAMEAFSHSGYEAASLNTICAENELSKGIIYHYYKDKDELYLLCVEKCFSEATAYLRRAAKDLTGSAEQRLKDYFDARLRFFAENQTLLGIFAGAAFAPPEHLAGSVAQLREPFDELNISVLTELLAGAPLQEGLSVEAVVQDFRMYMDFFNLRYKTELSGAASAKEALCDHEERCRRQLHILLYGVLGDRK